MSYRQILHDDLGCASYLIADGGEAAVIDPKWEIEEYLQLADENDFQITSILETHNHADMSPAADACTRRPVRRSTSRPGSGTRPSEAFRSRP
jgi:glyoxylase-like metal-dependent hydrolase (beta-lactamase superfamily II)